MLRSLISEFKKMKTAKYQIGIIIRDRRIVITKVRHTATGTELITVRHHRFLRDLGRFRQLDHCLQTMPPHFFRNSSVHLCVPFRQFTSQRVSLPMVTERDKISALLQLVDRKYEVWDYEEFEQSHKENKDHLEITLHKLKRSALEAYLIIFQKHIKHIDTVTTEQVLLRGLFETKMVAPIQGSFLLMDLSFRQLKIYIFVDHKITYHRVIPLGLEVALLSLVRSYKHKGQDIQINKEKAREILGTMNLFDYETTDTDYPVDRFFFQCRPFFEKIVLECAKTMGFYTKKNQDIQITGIRLMGGFLTIQGIQSYLQNALNISVDTLHYDQRIKAKNTDGETRFEESVCLAIATGLPQRAPQSFNMLPVEYVNFQRIKKWAPQTVGIGMLIFCGLSLLGFSKWHTIQSLTQQDTTLTENNLIANDSNLTNTPRFDDNTLKQSQNIQDKLAARPPIPETLYYFGQKTPKEVMLSHISITATTVQIKGIMRNESGKKNELRLTQDIGTLPYLKNIQQSDLQNSDGITTFELRADYSL
jgi:hypothetical protein